MKSVIQLFTLTRVTQNNTESSLIGITVFSDIKCLGISFSNKNNSTLSDTQKHPQTSDIVPIMVTNVSEKIYLRAVFMQSENHIKLFLGIPLLNYYWVFHGHFIIKLH